MIKQHIIIAGALLLLTGCGKKDDDRYLIGGPSGVPVSRIIAFKTLSPLQLQADNITPCLVTVKIDPGTDSINRVVIFSTGNGSFPNGYAADTVTANAYGIAAASFVSKRAGDAFVSARIRSYSIDTLVQFTAALPDNLHLTADKYTSDDVDSFRIDASVSRDGGRGQVTDPVKVFFSQTPSATGVAALVFPASTFTSEGVASITVKNPYKVTGTFDIVAKTVNDKGDSLTHTVTLVIQ